MEKDTGGQAFPMAATEWHGSDEGMTLRDYFAAKAMQASLPDQAYSSWDADRHARLAYNIADAMLRARDSNH